MQTRLSDDAYLEALEDATTTLAKLAATLDISERVPSCPDWTVLDLLEHLGGVHAWSRSVISGGDHKAPKPVLDGAEPVGWYVGQATQMLEAMRGVDPQQSSWSFRPDERVAAFWFRRQVHETQMHLVDLALVAGTADAHRPAHAADGISEAFDVMVPMMSRGRRVAVEAPIALVDADTGASWLLRPCEEDARVDYTYAPDAQDAAVTATAPAYELLTGLWGRTPHSRWQVDGDRAVLDALLASTLTP